ncbi:MAG: CHAT domain-containing protein, partial [Bacteroidota bacterium]
PGKTLSLAALLQEDIQAYPDANSMKVLLRLADRLWQWYQREPTEQRLQLATLAFEQLDRWYDPYHREEVQYAYRLSEYRSWIYKGLLRAYVEDYERSAKQVSLQKAFAASEQNKAFSLYKYLKRQSQLSFSGVPDTLVRREAALKAQLSFFNAKLTPGQEEGEQAQWIDQIKEIQVQYDALSAQLKRDYPTYYQLLHQEPIRLSDFQAMLQAREQAIIYARADSVLYAFNLTQDDVSVHQLPFAESLVDSLTQFREQLYSARGVNRTDPERLIHGGSHALYQALLEPMLGTRKLDMLYLIPDDLLALIPFEVLWTEVKNTRLPKERPYLLRRFPVAYTYSASLCMEQNGIKRSFDEDRPLAIFAPQYDENLLAETDSLVSRELSYLVREGLYDLEGARQEAEAISQYFGGEVIIGEEASKSRFLEVAPDFELLHLAMHASVSPDAPLLSKLIFADNPSDSLSRYLYAAELFALPLDAELVVLSACNTGYGKLQQGEGVMSLAKAFHYAGVPSVVMSLWQVPDQETQLLMTEFYAQLKAGQSKAAALRNAKLTYLDQVKAPELGHPFFWAGFVLSGNTQPLLQDWWLAPWIWALLAVAAVAGVGRLWKSRKT